MEDNAAFETIIESLRNDIAQVGPQLREIAEKVISEGISDYPIFVAAQEMIEIGKPIFDRDVVPVNWFFSASILEDFVRRELVKRENLGRFQRTFGDPSEKACIFVITGDDARFVFVPYTEEQEEES